LCVCYSGFHLTACVRHDDYKPALPPSLLMKHFTQVGDPIETAAVANIFGEYGIYIGSVRELQILQTCHCWQRELKPNLGHSEGASGLSSLIKMTLALEKKIIPPNINFTTPNPKSMFILGKFVSRKSCLTWFLVEFEKCKLKVPVEPMPWPKDRLERVGVNSFGVGGSNAHVSIANCPS